MKVKNMTQIFLQVSNEEPIGDLKTVIVIRALCQIVEIRMSSI